MDWIAIIAVVGLLLFWICLFVLPLEILRAALDAGPARTWSIVFVVAFAGVLLGFTRTMASGSLGEALVWSLAWFVPLAIAVMARKPPSTRWRKLDIYLVTGALATFLPANFLLLPTAILLAVRLLIWS